MRIMPTSRDRTQRPRRYCRTAAFRPIAVCCDDSTCSRTVNAAMRTIRLTSRAAQCARRREAAQVVSGAQIKAVAAEMTGIAERGGDALEAMLLVQLLRRVHAGQRFQIATCDSRGCARAPGTVAISALAGAECRAVPAGSTSCATRRCRLGSSERRDAAAAADAAVAFDDEIRATRLRIGAGHVVDFRIVNREARSVGAEFRHDRADDRGNGGVVVQV